MAADALAADKARTPTPMIAPNKLLLDVISGTSALWLRMQNCAWRARFPEQKLFLIRRALITMNNRSDINLRSDREHTHVLCASFMRVFMRVEAGAACSLGVSVIANLLILVADRWRLRHSQDSRLRELARKLALDATKVSARALRPHRRDA
jgi:hypothetical protein